MSKYSLFLRQVRRIQRNRRKELAMEKGKLISIGGTPVPEETARGSVDHKITCAECGRVLPIPKDLVFHATGVECECGAVWKFTEEKFRSCHKCHKKVPMCQRICHHCGFKRTFTYAEAKLANGSVKSDPYYTRRNISQRTRPRSPLQEDLLDPSADMDEVLRDEDEVEDVD